MKKLSIENLVKNASDFGARMIKSKLGLLYLLYVIYWLTASPHAVYEIHKFYKELSKRPHYQKENYESLLEDWARLKTSWGYREARNHHKRDYCGLNGTGGREALLDNVFDTNRIKTPPAFELSYGYVVTPAPYMNDYSHLSVTLYLPHLIICAISLVLLIILVFSFSEQTRWTRWTLHVLLFILFLSIIKIFGIVEQAHFLRTLELMITVEKNDQCLELLASETGLIYKHIDAHLIWLYAGTDQSNLSDDHSWENL